MVKIFAYNKWGAGDYLSHLKGVLDAYACNGTVNSINDLDIIFVSRSLAASELAKYYGYNVLGLRLKNLAQIIWAFWLAEVIILSIGAKKEYYLVKMISIFFAKKKYATWGIGVLQSDTQILHTEMRMGEKIR